MKWEAEENKTKTQKELYMVMGKEFWTDISSWVNQIEIKSQEN